MKTMDPKKLFKALPKLAVYMILWFGFFVTVTSSWQPVGWWWVGLMIVQMLSLLEILHQCTKHCINDPNESIDKLN